MEISVLTTLVQATGPELMLEVRFDRQVIFFGAAPVEPMTIEHRFNDGLAGAEHLVEFVLSGKRWDHTEINGNGEIVSDRTVIINDFRLDDIVVDQLVHKTAKYHHDYNGSSEAVVDQFMGSMGCNGAVHWCFTSPVYQWILDNM